MNFQIFRLGQYLVLGQVNESGLEASYVRDGAKWRPILPSSMKVSEAFIVNSNYELDSSTIEEDKDSKSVEDLVHEVILPHLTMRNIRMGEVEVVAYQKRVGLGLKESKNWLPLSEVLSNVQIGQYIALESLRPKLENLGMVEEISHEPVVNNFVELPRPIHVFMKTGPFRDVTKIHEKTTVSVLGYYRGCAVLEADGEMFWRPLEETTFWDQDTKPKSYFFNMDMNRDLKPDPLQALPSKSALGVTPSRKENNFNVQPELHKIAGHFAAIKDISVDPGDYGILGESYVGTHGYEDDERLLKEPLHDLGVEPGLDGADHDRQVSKAVADKDADTVWNDDGKDGTPKGYDGEYGEETPPDDGTDAHPDAQPDELNIREATGVEAYWRASKLGKEYPDPEIKKAFLAGFASGDMKKCPYDKKSTEHYAYGMGIAYKIHHKEKKYKEIPERATSEEAMDAVMNGANVGEVLDVSFIRDATFNSHYNEGMKETFPLS